MTTNDIDAQALLLDRTYFALNAKGFAAFQDLLDNSPAITDCRRRTLTAQAPWGATSAAMRNTGRSEK